LISLDIDGLRYVNRLATSAQGRKRLECEALLSLPGLRRIETTRGCACYCNRQIVIHEGASHVGISTIQSRHCVSMSSAPSSSGAGRIIAEGERGGMESKGHRQSMGRVRRCVARGRRSRQGKGEQRRDEGNKIVSGKKQIEQGTSSISRKFGNISKISAMTCAPEQESGIRMPRLAESPKRLTRLKSRSSFRRSRNARQLRPLTNMGKFAGLSGLIDCILAVGELQALQARPGDVHRRRRDPRYTAFRGDVCAAHQFEREGRRKR